MLVSIRHTTMKVESHWSSMKRILLLLHNQPRSDFLAQIVGVGLLPEHSDDFNTHPSDVEIPYS